MVGYWEWQVNSGFRNIRAAIDLIQEMSFRRDNFNKKESTTCIHEEPMLARTKLDISISGRHRELQVYCSFDTFFAATTALWWRIMRPARRFKSAQAFCGRLSSQSRIKQLPNQLKPSLRSNVFIDFSDSTSCILLRFLHPHGLWWNHYQRAFPLRHHNAKCKPQYDTRKKYGQEPDKDSESGETIRFWNRDHYFSYRG